MENWTSLLGSQIGVAWMTTKGIQILKKTPLCPWLTLHSDSANRWVSISIAAMVTIGFRFQMDGSLEAGSVLSITIPPIGALVDGVIQFATQAGLNEGMYKNVVKPPPRPIINTDTVTVTNITNQPGEPNGITAQR